MKFPDVVNETRKEDCDNFTAEAESDVFFLFESGGPVLLSLNRSYGRSWISRECISRLAFQPCLMTGTMY
jgi:hypothetical protein